MVHLDGEFSPGLPYPFVHCLFPVGRRLMGVPFLLWGDGATGERCHLRATGVDCREINY